MDWYLTQAGTDINVKDKDGYSALTNALQHMRLDSAEYLLERVKAGFAIYLRDTRDEI